MDRALRAEGLEQLRLFPKYPKVWSLPGGDLIRFFAPDAHRRPWGFVYSGVLGVTVPSLRSWLDEHKPGENAGIFEKGFIGYHLMNEDVFRDFMVEHDKPFPADLWAGLLKDRLERVPSTLDGLVSAYRYNMEELGWLAQPHLKHFWDYLLQWHDHPDPARPVPRALPDGRVV